MESLKTIFAMTNELDALEIKVARIVTLCHDLRAENAKLRQQLAAAQAARAVLVDRMDTARAQIERLAAQFPDDSGNEEPV